MMFLSLVSSSNQQSLFKVFKCVLVVFKACPQIVFTFNIRIYRQSHNSRFVFLFFVFLSFFFFFFSHIIQHSIQKYNKTKQQTHTQHLKVQSKGREKGKDNKNTKVTPPYNHVYQAKTLPSINGRRLGSIDSRRCTFTRHYLQEATDPICFSTHAWCKPVLYYCLLRSCKTSKQHSLLHCAYTETRVIIKKTQTWVNRPINSQ